MAMGKLSSLGVGSNVLNYDVIDKLKKADEKAMIEPIDKKLKENIEKEAELATMIGMLDGMRNNSSVLADYSSFLGRKTTVSGDELRATAAPGTPLQDIQVEIKQVAKNDINEVGTRFQARDSVFTTEDTLLKFTAKGHQYKIAIKGGSTLEEVAQLVTDKSGGNAIGTVMRTGGAYPFQLMISSKDTGEENRIYFGSTLQSEEITSGSLELGEEALELVLKDANGLDQSVEITLPPTPETNKSSDNAQVLKEAIKEAIKENPELEGLLGSDINIGIGVGGKSLVINDRRGYQVQVLGSEAKNIGFKSTETPEEIVVQGKEPVSGGEINGKISIGGIPLDLEELTSKRNTGEENAQAISEAFNNIAGVYMYADENGKLVIKTDSGDVFIKAEDEEGKEALKKLGLREGNFADYSKTQEGIFKLKNLQAGQDAVLLYNGATIIRPKNDIDDIVSGIKLELIKPTKEDSPVTISVTSDTENIVEQVKELVEKYNELMPKVTETTKYDPDSQTAGIFNGVSYIRQIRSSINQIFSITSGSGTQTQSLLKYGISLDDNSKMTLDESKLQSALSTDPDSVRDFFVGVEKQVYGRDTRVGGVFKTLTEKLEELTKGSNSTLKLYEQSLTKDDKRLKEDRRKTMERLNSRYDTMAQRFAAYDSQIAKTNNSFNSVQMMIDQAAKKK